MCMRKHRNIRRSVAEGTPSLPATPPLPAKVVPDLMCGDGDGLPVRDHGAARQRRCQACKKGRDVRIQSQRRCQACKHKLRDLIRAPYVSYGVKYIDLVSLGKKGARC